MVISNLIRTGKASVTFLYRNVRVVLEVGTCQTGKEDESCG